MIKVHRLNGKEMFLNAELVESVGAFPTTWITLITGRRFHVRETAETIIEQLIQYRITVNAAWPAAHWQSAREKPFPFTLTPPS